MEFSNLYRHVAYVQALCDHCASVGYQGADVVRVELSIEDGDWRVWASKGLKYWYFRCYYRVDFLKSTSDPPPRLSSMCSHTDLPPWMLATIRRSAEQLLAGSVPFAEEGATQSPVQG
jgi:hypothetical protein